MLLADVCIGVSTNRRVVDAVCEAVIATYFGKKSFFSKLACTRQSFVVSLKNEKFFWTVLTVAVDSSLCCNYIFPADLTWFEISCYSSVSPAVNKMIKEHGDLFSDSQCKVCSAALISESQKLTHYQVSASQFPAAVLMSEDLTHIHTYQHKGTKNFSSVVVRNCMRLSTSSWLVLGSR